MQTPDRDIPEGPEPDFDHEELVLDDEKLEELIEEQLDRETKHDHEAEIPEFDYTAVHGPKLN